MARCPVCGSKVKKGVHSCPICGSGIGPDMEDPHRDYWAEKLIPLVDDQNPEDSWTGEPQDQEDSWTEEVPAEDESWTEEVPDGELKDLYDEADSEKTAWTGPAVEDPRQEEKSEFLDVKPRPRPVLSVTFWVLTMAAMLLLFFAGVRKLTATPEPVPGSGTYYLVNFSDGDRILNPEENWVQLRADGMFRISLMGSLVSGDWVLNGRNLRMDTREYELAGLVMNGCLTMDLSGTQYIFALPGFEHLAPGHNRHVSHPTVPSVLPQYERWEGDYYGFLVFANGTGEFQNLDGKALDVCCRIEAEEEGMGTVTMWNEENKSEKSFCSGNVLFTEGTGPMGKMILEWGVFYGMDMEPGEWAVDPGKSKVSHIEDLCYIHGTFLDVQKPQSGYSYEIYLMPWGKSWEGAMAEDPMLEPPGYESWYLPLIRTGQKMPDHF